MVMDPSGLKVVLAPAPPTLLSVTVKAIPSFVACRSTRPSPFGEDILRMVPESRTQRPRFGSQVMRPPKEAEDNFRERARAMAERTAAVTAARVTRTQRMWPRDRIQDLLAMEGMEAVGTVEVISANSLAWAPV